MAAPANERNRHPARQVHDRIWNAIDVTKKYIIHRIPANFIESASHSIVLLEW